MRHKAEAVPRLKAPINNVLTNLQFIAKLLALLGIILAAIFVLPTVAVAARLDKNNKGKGEPCDGFKLIKGDPYTANRVILAEDHLHKSETLACLEKITKNRGAHTVSTEKAEGPYNCEDVGIPQRKDRSCVGWDIKQNILSPKTTRMMSKYPLIIFEITVLNWLMEFYVVRVKESSVRKADMIFAELIKDKNELFDRMLPDLEKKHNLDGECDIQQCDGNVDKIGLLRGLIKIVDQITEAHKKGSTYYDILQSLMAKSKSPENVNSVSLNGGYEFFKTQHERNRNMFKVLTQHSHIFSVTVAGAAHVVETNPAALYLQAELEKEEHQNPCAILATTHINKR